ncbi:OmpA family protein [Candidatus Poribacteria bacterium]|nr:OmpA family protein [Candidatus Poribacteria bacterium]MYA71155.1 OmpA family protein [Candidatus Poribacteria bacterium]MYH80369.1 OmpA family protein [Candidatus Poribacteria bacterium]MYK92539.1 OmpA family protein [Candidatus Poribacteria bacterium]
MDAGKKKRIIIMVASWLVIIGVIGLVYKFVVEPWIRGDLVKETSTQRYAHNIKVAHDSFPGYAILRSPAVQNLLDRQGLKLTFVDDKADYVGRIRALKSGKVQMAVFTIDAYLKAGSVIGEFPGSIVLVIDESKGADAIVAYKRGVPQIPNLSNPRARIVLTPDSPSETLARIMINKMSLPSLPSSWAVETNGAEDAYKKLKSADPDEPRAYVIWEPYVTKALAIEGVHLLLDSSKLKGYIVDVLVVQREFLDSQRELVTHVVQAYLRANYDYNNQPDGLAGLIQSDAKQYGDSLNRNETDKLVKGIEWRNTVENYAHFGVIPSAEAKGAERLEAMIAKITQVLVQTNSISTDPVSGNYEQLFFEGILRSLHHDKFHPGMLNASGNDGLDGIFVGSTPMEEVREEASLNPLSDANWNSLAPVAAMKVEPIQFGRGNARILPGSNRALQELSANLKSFPQYYLRVVGHTRQEGDPAANRVLALQRAEAAAASLRNFGIANHRIRAIASNQTSPQMRGAAAQSVTFELLGKPY